MTSKDHHLLFQEFPGISREDWIEKIGADLKDPGAFEKLIWKSEEGFHADPFYRAGDMGPLGYLENLRTLRNPSPAPNGWIICQEVPADGDPAMAGDLMQEALKGGAQALRIRVSGSKEPGFQELKTMLGKIPLAETEILFQGGMRIDARYDGLCELSRQRATDASHLKGALGADPIGFMVGSGLPVASLENLGRLIMKVSEKSPALKILDVNGAHFQNAGSTLVQELAFTLSMASDYLATLTERGIDPLKLQESMQVYLATGPLFFPEIAKLRAARILWAHLAEAYGIPATDARIQLHATTARWNQTLYDPHVNMLRATSEAMAAVLGGADYITVLPYDGVTGKATPLSQRMARNVQIILREEAYLDKVADPASGSYYLEKLTDLIGESAWDLFRQVESRGGFTRAFQEGWIQDQVMGSRNRKKDMIDAGTEKLIGTSSFPDPAERKPVKPGSAAQADEDHPPLVPLNLFRPSAALEELRITMDNLKQRPRVLLLKYGKPNWALARAVFISNFFSAGGFEPIETPVSASLNDAVDLVLSSNFEVVVLCSSDEEYKELGAAVLPVLPPEAMVVVAGNPTSSRQKLEELGIVHFIHRDSHLLKTLQMIASIILK